MDERSKTRLVRIVLALLPVAFILAGGTQSIDHGRLSGAAEADSIVGYGAIGANPDARLDDFAYDRRPEEERSEFENVMTSACGAGDVFGCGLLLTWRALLILLHVFEQVVIFVLIALAFRWFVWTRIRETIEKRSRRAQRPM
ncbi:hypothetical protein [Rhodoblastus sp.]|jgi:hypothetical protein|uniref:hypothetical protein n=1 Tax=Rhodoblastus sp. TaxID=1962975 RepID=UPI0025E82A55|nr:hypothetical protein [Rhodoblastus sp.]